MGTTESSLWQDEDDDGDYNDDDEPYDAQQKQQQHHQSERRLPSPSQQHRPLPKPPSSASLSSSQRSSGKPVGSGAPIPSSLSTIPTIRLHGLIMGMSQTGKQTLLQRLEGKDPFAYSVKKHAGTKSKGSTNSMGDEYSYNDEEEEEKKTETTVPYKPPPAAGAEQDLFKVLGLLHQNHHDRIQLNVKLSRTVPSSSSHPFDFAILLINPSHDPGRIRDYLIQSITSFVHLQGYGEDDDHDDEEKDAQAQQGDDSQHINQHPQENKHSQKKQKRPICLCLLLNFRDRKDMVVDSSKKKGKDRTSHHIWLEAADVHTLTMQILQQFHSIDPYRLVVRCVETSLFNCYGLQVLHHFIYQTYWHRKRCDMEETLHHIHKISRTAASATPEMPYSDFLQVVAAQQRPATNQLKSPAKHITATSMSADSVARNNPARSRRQVMTAATAGNGTNEESVPTNTSSPEMLSPVAAAAASDAANRPVERRAPGYAHKQSMKSTPTRVSAAALRPSNNPRAALEAFLASDSESDHDDKESADQHHGNYSNMDGNESLAVDDDDDDDDEDFFYDEQGTRQSSKAKRHREQKQKQRKKENEKEKKKGQQKNKESVAVSTTTQAVKSDNPVSSTQTKKDSSAVIKSDSTSIDNELTKQKPIQKPPTKECGSTEAEVETSSSCPSSPPVLSSEQEADLKTSNSNDESTNESVQERSDQSTGSTPEIVSSQNVKTAVVVTDEPISEQEPHPCKSNGSSDTMPTPATATMEKSSAIASNPSGVSQSVASSSPVTGDPQPGEKVLASSSPEEKEAANESEFVAPPGKNKLVFDSDDDSNDDQESPKVMAAANYDDDDDGFIIASTPATTSRSKSTRRKNEAFLENDPSTNSRQNNPTTSTASGSAVMGSGARSEGGVSSGGGGLSAAALAAIAAAKEEAEHMLQQQLHQPHATSSLSSFESNLQTNPVVVVGDGTSFLKSDSRDAKKKKEEKKKKHKKEKKSKKSAS